MYKIERADQKYIEFEMGKQVHKVYLGGIGMYRRYIDALDRFSVLQKKLDTIQKAGQSVPKDFIELLGDSVIMLLQICFGEELADKIIAFFDNNYDELLEQVFPFIEQEFVPALRKQARKQSREKAGIEITIDEPHKK